MRRLQHTLPFGAAFPPEKQRPGSARRRGRACGPSLYACASFQVAVQFVHLAQARQ